MRKRSIVLLSGGLDSAANLAFCIEKDEPVSALTVRYGQRAQEREAAAGAALAAHYGIRHRVLDLPWLGALGGSSLTDRAQAVPKLDPESPGQLDDLGVVRETARAVWVPNRNGVLVNVAGALADREGAAQVVVGFNAEEATTFPDNSADFLRAVSGAFAYSTSNRVELACYTLEWDKSRIVHELRKLSNPFPFEKIWSCYHGDAMPCGQCESCLRFARAMGRG